MPDLKDQGRGKIKKDKFYTNGPLLSVDLARLEAAGVSLKELKDCFPRYIINPTPLSYGLLKHIWLQIVLFFSKRLGRILLRPRSTPVRDLDLNEVNEVYSTEAKTYNEKHHLITRGMDMIWRRTAGWVTTVVGRYSYDRINILDLCTGTGLTIQEMLLLLETWGITAEITGLDYNPDMLAIAKSTVKGSNKVCFVRGNAMDLVADEKSSADGLTRFKRNSFDAITQVCGIGGIQEPLKVFEGVLQILKPGGQFFMIDVHRPIPEQSGEWSLFLKWCHFPVFEAVIYEQGTVPIVLNRLWGWRDTTLCFYLLPLITCQNDDGRYWGFKVQSFEVEYQRWWFALPLMTIGKIAVEKVEINQKVAKTRKTILEACHLKT